MLPEPVSETTSPRAGASAAVATREPWLSREAEAELVFRIKRYGDRDAADALARAHTHEVVKSALKYRGYGVAVNELIAEGQFGLAYALQKFEPERGVRFTTYARHWVRASMMNYVLKSWSVVGGGSRALHTRWFFRLRRERARVESTLGIGEAAEQETAKRVGVSTDQVRQMIQRLETRDLSLEATLAPDSPARLADQLPSSDNQENSLLERQMHGSLERAVARALETLDPRERYIVEQRLMADANEELSLTDIGRTLGVSRERARQLETRAKRKLKKRIPALGDAVVQEWLTAG
jgi:RNA polymerase sigma-32 factor